ncbi:polysaccharide pyruvyl transferase family protein [Vagococcus fluvialis]|uniref:polysaccharide pyruvyl transferase family protein n=1 Tax=Vagococcus fluvialis TaxID=2738 RepID=UPI003B5C21F3
MKTIFISFCDSHNLGDLLIVETLEKNISSHSAVKTFSFDLKPKNMAHYENLNVKKNNEHKLKQIYLGHFRKLLIFDILHYIKYKQSIRKYDWKNLENELIDSDLVIIGGGNTIFGTTKMMSSTDKVLEIMKFVRQKSEAKIFLNSVGIGPFHSKMQFHNLSKIIEIADYITVRDKNSLKFIEENKKNVHLTTDPVLFLDKFKDQSKEHRVIGFSVMDIRLNRMDQQDYFKYISSMVNLVKQLSHKLPDYKFILFSTDLNDYKAVWDVANKLNEYEVEVVEINNFEILKNTYNKMDMCIGARMHSLIIAFSQNIPVIGFSWQPKIYGFFEMINKKENVFEILSISEELDKIIDLTMSTIHNLDESRQELINCQNKLYDSQMINDVIINEVKNEQL